MKTLFTNYLNTFRGLSREVWWLSLITLINRAGTMVIPFLTIYLKEELHFEYAQVGWIMSAFGFGSFAGAWIGGKLTDKIGYYKVMVLSLILSGFLFIWVQELEKFWQLSLGVFLLMTVADAFRPAMFVAVSAYSKPENKTRSIALIRLAINMGFSAGPALGGLVIVSIGYTGLFWIDGLTCILAGLILLNVLHPKKSKVLDNIENKNPKSAYSDWYYIVFLIALVLFGVVFLQYFSTIPLYYSEVHALTQDKIGLILAMNGLIICAFEMPLVKWLENTGRSMMGLMLFGGILTMLSFVVLNLTGWIGILIIGMFLMTVGEMISFPFSNAFAMQRAKRGNQGEFMALYSMTFAISHIIGHNFGMQMVDSFGFEITWHIITGIMLVSVLILALLRFQMKKQNI
jgi:predicted MFS family arabinose efflux permease